MGLTINNNVAQVNAGQQAGRASQAVKKSLEGMAAGLRINKAADDAAGLAIAEGFRTQVRQTSQEVNNLQTGASVIQTADQALGTQREALGRIQELATQASNGTLNADQRKALNQEAQQLVQQINQTANDTEFNGTKLLNGTAGSINVGAGTGNTININSSTSAALGVSGVDLTTQQGATAASAAVQSASSQIDQNRASLGAQANGIASAVETRQAAGANAQASESAIRDQDTARAAIQKAQSAIRLQRSTSAVVQGNLIAQSAAQLLGT